MTTHLSLSGTADQLLTSNLSHLYPIEQDICHTILNAWEDIQPRESNTWTKSLLGTLSELGRKQNFLTPPFRMGGHTLKEWLFDLVWMTGHSEELKDRDPSTEIPFEQIRTINRMVLACESEFGGYEADIVEDFMKLTVCNADFRLFTYLNRDVNLSGERSGKAHPVDICTSCCKVPCHNRYLLIGLPNTGSTTYRIDALIL